MDLITDRRKTSICGSDTYKATQTTFETNIFFMYFFIIYLRKQNTFKKQIKDTLHFHKIIYKNHILLWMFYM